MKMELKNLNTKVNIFIHSKRIELANLMKWLPLQVACGYCSAYPTENCHLNRDQNDLILPQSKFNLN